MLRGPGKDHGWALIFGYVKLEIPVLHLGGEVCLTFRNGFSS